MKVTIRLQPDLRRGTVEYPQYNKCVEECVVWFGFLLEPGFSVVFPDELDSNRFIPLYSTQRAGVMDAIIQRAKDMLAMEISGNDGLAVEEVFVVEVPPEVQNQVGPVS